MKVPSALQAVALVVCLSLGAGTVFAQAATPSTAEARDAAQAAASGMAQQLSLRWEALRGLVDPATRQERTEAAFVLQHRGGPPLPATGWSLYFSAMGGASSAPGADVVVEPVVGTLYRLRPAPGFQAVQAGDTRSLKLVHGEALLLLDKAPQAPYWVFDATPARAHGVPDFRLVPLAPEPGEAVALYTRYAQASPLPASALPALLPTPVRLQPGRGSLHWPRLPQVLAVPALQTEQALARELLAPYFSGSDPGRTDKTGAGPGSVRLALAGADAFEGLDSPEAYELVIDPQAGVSVRGRTAAGVSRGLQTLRALLPTLPAQPRAEGVRLDALRIVDAPRFAHRGLMLDLARNFQNADTVKAWIDRMARFKLNVLHLHLSDDEGWRLAIAGLPELTQVGARRGHSTAPQQGLEHLPSAHGSGPEPTDRYGSGFLSAAQYQDILRHAAARQVEVIPEFDLPAHARAAIVAMEARTQRLLAAGDPKATQFRLRDPADRSVYRSAQQHIDNVMDPGLPSTYAFIDHVVREVAQLHKAAGVPLRTLHVGGDEQPVGAWEGSPASQALMREQGLKDTAALWDHFFTRVAALVKAQGAAVAGWEELGARRERVEGQPRQVANPRFNQQGFTLYVWNNLEGSEDLAYRLANAGYRTVLAPATHLYFDMAHLRHPAERGHNWAAYVDVDTVFGLRPFHLLDGRQVPGAEALTPAGRGRIAGLQATLFSETLRTPAHINHLALPRLLALAERAWAPEPAWEAERQSEAGQRAWAEDWSRFANLLGQRLLPRLALEWPKVAPRIGPPGLRREGGQVHANAQFPGTTLRYTTDGREPKVDSPEVRGPIGAHGPITVAAFDALGRSSRSSRMDNPPPDWANLGAYRAANAQLPPPNPAQPRVVFMGDSITEFWDKPQQGWFADPSRINRGISGQTTPQMLLRFRPDVLDLKPRAVVLLAGTNDIAGNTGPTTVEAIAGHLRSMAELARANGVKVLLCSVLPASAYYWNPAQRPAGDIRRLNLLLRQVAADTGATYLDLHTPMKDAEGGLPKTFADDGVHPNAAGYARMESLVAPALKALLGDKP